MIHLTNLKSLYLQLFFLFSIFLLLITCEKKPTEPEEPGPVTFEGRAFLVGQPPPVNPWHLPLHFDIEIISFLPGDSTTIDTTYTDSSGVYSSTRLRQDGRYTIISRYPFYSNDTVYVAVNKGQVVGEIPRLFSQRLLRTTIFPDSLEYYSVNSRMCFTIFTSNLSPRDTLVASWWRNQFLVPKNSSSTDISTLLKTIYTVPNDVFGVELLPLQTYVVHDLRLLKHFSDDKHILLPISGDYYLYAWDQLWASFSMPFDYWHYQKNKWRWWFKIMDPTEIKVKLN